MDNKKIEVEFSVKDNLTKKLKSMSDEVKNIAKEIQSSIKQIENSFSNINIKTNMSSKVKSINDQIKNIGKDIKDVEVDIKANVDTSGLNNASSLGMVGATLGLGDATKGISDATKGMNDAVKGMSSSIKEMFQGGIAETEVYKQKIVELQTALENYSTVANTGNFGTDEWFDAYDSLNEKLPELIRNFELFGQNGLDAANKIVSALNHVKQVIDSISLDKDIDIGEINFDKDRISSEINSAIEATKPKKGVKIPVDIQEIANAVAEIAQLEGKISKIKVDIKVNDEKIKQVKQEIESLQNIPKLNVDQTGLLESLQQDLNGYIAQQTKLRQELIKSQNTLAYFNKQLKITTTSFATTIPAIEKLKNSFKNLGDSFKNIGSKFKNLGNTFKSLGNTIGGKLKTGLTQLKNKLLDTSSGADKLKSSLGGLRSILSKLGIMFGVAQLINFGKSAIQTASSLQEVQNVIDVVFGNSSETVNQWAKETAGAFGLTELQAKKFSGTFGSIFKASGVDTSFIDDMSMKLSQLAGDMASFHDISQQDAFEKLRAGITGSVEPLQSLGYNLNAATMEAYALSRGINVSWNELSEADKQILRYNYLLQVTAGVQGDFARTSGSFANQVRGLSNAFSQLKSEVGIALMAALAPVINVIATIIQWLTALMQVFNNFLRSIGLIKGVASNVASAVGGVVGGITDMAGGVGDVADALDGVGSSAGAAGEKVAELAKEMKGLMGIDELNVLPEPDKGSGSGSGSGGSGGSGGGAGAGGVGGIGAGGLVDPDSNDYTGKFEDMVAKMREKIEQYLGTINFEPLITSFKGLLESIKPILDTIGEAVIWFITEILEPLGRFTIEKALPEFFDGLAAIFTILSPILDAFCDSFAWFTEAVLKPIASFVADKFIEAWDLINEALTKFGDWLKGDGSLVAEIIGTFAASLAILAGVWLILNGVVTIWNVVGTIAAGVWAFLTAPITLVVLAIAAVITIIVLCIKHWDEIKEAGAKAWDWIKEKASACWNWIKDAFGALGDWFKTTVIEPIKNFFSDAWSKISEAASSCWNAICKVWEIACNWFEGRVLTPIKNFFTNTWNNIKTSVSNTWTNICNVWKIASTWFNNNVLTPIKNVFTTVWNNIKQIPKNAWDSICNVYQGAKSWFSNIFDGVKTAITSKFDAVKTKVSSVFENVKNTVYNAIEKIKGFFRFDWSLPHIKLPHFSISGSANPLKWITEGVPKISVSWYADGGIMTKPSLFGINGNSLMIGGEAGAEAIVPLDLLWNNMDKFAEKIVAGIVNSQSQDINLRVDLDGKQVASSVIKNINRQTKLNGRSPLK